MSLTTETGRSRMMPSMHRSERVVGTLMEVDPEFQQLTAILYGPDVEAEDVYQDVFKRQGMTPEQKRQQTEARIGLASNYVGLAAGTAGLAAAAQDPRLARSRGGRAVLRGGKVAGKLVPKKVTRTLLKHPGKVAAGALGLQGANLAGDAIANRVLGRSAKGEVKKYYLQVNKAAATPKVADQASGIYNSMLRMLKPTGNVKSPAAAKPSAGPNGGQRAGGVGTWAANLRDKPVQTMTGTAGGGAILGAGGTFAATRPGKKRAYNQGAQDGFYAKADNTKINKPMPDLQLAGTFSKFDDEKRQAFGYASVVKKDGMPVIDRQGDYIDLEEMEKAAYHYVQKSRVGGDMHRRNRDEYGIDRAHHVSDLIESMVFTEEKCKQMGLPDEVAKKLDGHWWVGYQIHDEDTWQEVRKKGRTGFSIHGRGKRVDTTIDELVT